MAYHWVFGLEVLDEQTVIAAVNDSFLLRSKDAGTTWQKIGLGAQGASALAIATENVVWVVGRKGCFYNSLDGGQNWQRSLILPTSVTNTDWNSIAFVDARRGAAVGQKGVIVITDDGGKSWVQYKTDVSDDLRSVELSRSAALITSSRAIYRLDLPTQASKPSQ